MIRIQNLHKYYGSRQAVGSLSCRISRAETVGLLGPNGSGKSTIMNILAGFLSPSRGEIEIGGYNLREQPQKTRELIGYLPENPPLYRELTVLEALQYIGRLKKLDPKQLNREKERVLSLTGLETTAARKIGNLSKGYRQRVGLAQALLGDPPILFLDEPTIGLDPRQISEIRQLLQILRPDHTILLSSHILSEVEASCQKVLVLSQGRLIAEDSVESLRHRIDLQQSELLLELTGLPEQEAELGRIFEDFHIKDFTLLSSQKTLAERAVPFYQIRLSGPPDRSGRDPEAVQFRLDLTAALAKRGFQPIGIRFERKTLEQIFLRLTQTEPATGEPH